MFVSNAFPKQDGKIENFPVRDFLTATMKKVHDFVQKYPKRSCIISGLAGVGIAIAFTASMCRSEIENLNRTIKWLERSNPAISSYNLTDKIFMCLGLFLLCGLEGALVSSIMCPQDMTSFVMVPIYRGRDVLN